MMRPSPPRRVAGILALGLVILSAASVLILSGCPADTGGSETTAPSPMPPSAEPGTDEGDDSTAGPAISISGSATIAPIARAWSDAYSGAEITVSADEDLDGFQALVSGTTDIAMLTRELRSEEKSLAEEAGVDPVSTEVARDALVVIVHPDNPVDELTGGQAWQIFSGAIKRWSVLGAPGVADDSIIVVDRQPASGAYLLWRSAVLSARGEDDTTMSDGALVRDSDEEVRRTVASTPGAIGYISMGFLDATVKALAVEATYAGEGFVYATPATVKDNSYPLARPLHFYTDGEATGAVADFMEWTQSDEAQELVGEEGFVALN